MKKLIITYSILLIPCYFVSAQTITTIAGNGVQGYGGDGGPATLAELNVNFGIFTDALGILYIADNQNHRAREVDASGNITTFAGNGISGYSGNGGPATSAEIENPADIVTDALGNIYIVDFGNATVREVHTAGKISTFAGVNSYGYSGDGGPATLAELNNPCGLAVDDSGKVYISDRGNNRIRVVDTAGNISTFAGNGYGGFSGDGGPAGAAELNGSNGINFDASGNLYIADYLNNRVREINTSGIISTIGGNGFSSYSGDGGPATLAEMANPMGVAVDASGNVYVADHSESRVRLINTSGIISTFAGNGIPAYSGDGGPATSAEISYPSGVCFDVSGNLYVSDAGNSRVRKITGITTNTNTTGIDSKEVTVYPNPSNGIFNIVGTQNLVSKVEVYNVLGERVETQCIVSLQTTYNLDLSSQPNGFYLYRILSEKGEVIKEGKLVLQK